MRGDSPVLRGRRVTLRPLVLTDFEAWREVRQRNVVFRPQTAEQWMMMFAR